MLIRKTFLAAAALGGLAAAAVQPAAAQTVPGGWRRDYGALLEGVTLSDAQKTSLHALMRAARADSQGLRAQVRAVHEQVEAALLSPGSVTEAAVVPLLAQREALTQQLDAKRLSSQIAVRNLLTPDQLAAAARTHARLATLRQQERALRGADGPAD